MRALGFRAQPLQQRQGKSGGLAGAGLRAGENVAPLQNDGDGLAAEWVWLAIALVGHGTE